MVFPKQPPFIASTFCIVHNHERYFITYDYKILEQQGILLSNNVDCVAEIKRKKMWSGGLSTQYDLEWVNSYSRKDGYKILMCHYREVKNTEVDMFDYVVAVHYHIGQ